MVENCVSVREANATSVTIAPNVLSGIGVMVISDMFFPSCLAAKITALNTPRG